MAMNDSQLTTQANVIKNETATGANTATRVGTMLDDIISNKINNDKIDTDGTLAANSDALVASQKATKTYVNAGLALKEDTANKSNAALGTSATLFPTQNAVKTYVDGQVATVNGSITSGLALKENTANKSNGPLGTSAILFPTENSVTNALVPKENISDKVTTQATFISNGSSVVKYPAIKAVKDYVDGVTTGLLKDNGNYDPTITSNYPTAADTLSGGPIQVGDLWYIDTNGTMNSNAVLVGYSVRALVNAAGPTTDADWAIANVGLGFVPENSANKSTDGTFNSGVPSVTLFPTQSAVATYVAANAQDLDQVLTNGDTSTSNLIIGNTLTTPTEYSSIGAGYVDIYSTNTDSYAQYRPEGITIDRIISGNQMIINYNNNNQTIDFPSGSGTLALTSAIPAAGWGLTGNAGTTAGTNFIGTTDAEDVIFKANGVERLKIDYLYGDVYTTNSFRALNLSTSTAMQAIGAGGSYAIMGQDSATYGGGFLGLGNTGGRNGVIRCDNITLADREFQLPDANGTFVLSVNGSAPDAAGNITVAVSAPSLSAVTAVGNTTTSDIIVNGSVSSSIQVDSAGSGIARIGYTSSWKGHLLISTGTGSGVIRANNVTAGRTLQFPDADGTIALQSYKVYSALVQYNGFNFTVVSLLENTLGATISWAAGFSGPTATASSPVFTANKTVIIPSGYYAFGVYYTSVGARVSDTSLNVVGIRPSDGSISSVNGYPFLLEIRVYA